MNFDTIHTMPPAYKQALCCKTATYPDIGDYSRSSHRGVQKVVHYWNVITSTKCSLQKTIKTYSAYNPEIKGWVTSSFPELIQLKICIRQFFVFMDFRVPFLEYQKLHFTHLFSSKQHRGKMTRESWYFHFSTSWFPNMCWIILLKLNVLL